MTHEIAPLPPANPTAVWKVLGLILLTILFSVGISIWVVMLMLFPGDFKPVTLNPQEE